jgi:hypothetical protein
MRLAGLPFLVFATSLTTAALPARGYAADGDVPTAVLGIEPLEGATDAVAAEITDALRQRVAATKGYQLLQGKDLVEVKLVFACPDAAPACMSQAGKSLGADKLIFGNVKRSGNDYQVTLKLLDVSRAVVESFTAETVPRKQADASGLRSLAPGWLAKLSGKGGGSIQVRANFPGAAVSLDGTQVGTTGNSPVVINDVAPGRHEVAVEKSGYTTTKQEFTLAAGQSLPLSLTLSPVSVEVPRPEGSGKEPEGGSGEPGGGDPTITRIGFWIAVVGTVASAAAALKFGLDVRDINNQLDQYRRFPCTPPKDPSKMCNGNGEEALPLMPGEPEKAQELTEKGNRDELLQWVFVGLTGAFAIAGGVLLYKGYLAASEGKQSASNHGLRLFPTATASSGGIIAEFEF